MTRDEECELVLAFARTLYVNGQGTELTLAAAQRLAGALGLRVNIGLRWAELDVQREENGRPVWRTAAAPTGVHMNRVVAAMQALDDVMAGRLARDAARKEIDVIAIAPPAPTWMFALAAGVGALALAVILGGAHPVDALIIFASAVLGAGLRRGLATVRANAVAGPFCASLLAGAVAAMASRHGLISSLRLVAICPCLILIPGSHVLNGAADLISGRIHLGAARLIHAGLVMAAISTGLLLALVLFGVSLPIQEPVRAVALWEDVIAAGVAVAAFCILFSMPLNMLAWPVAVGALAHALRWVAIMLDFSAAAGTLVACLMVGTILIPVARRRRLPFAAIGFASVVSMIPGAYLLTMLAGLLQISRGEQTSLELISVTIASGTTAMIIVLAIILGLIIPKMTMDYVDEKWSPSSKGEEDAVARQR